MPELPELEVMRDVLQRRVVGRTISEVEMIGGALVVRDLTNEGFAQALTGAHLDDVRRRGKFLVFALTDARSAPLCLIINPKLTGRLQLAAPGDKRMAKTHVVMTLQKSDSSKETDFLELRYVDQKQMGQLYLTRQPPERAAVPDFAGMGPEPLDLSFDEFKLRLKPFRGEIKGVLVRSDFVAGIGNAYADEILWAARIHPYRKRTSLTADEVQRLYDGMRSTLIEATARVRAEMGENIYLKPRDFLNVHMKTSEPCPRCGSPIALVGANQRITNFCRTCQPGGLIKGM
jgi:formamidopyrimidine-DNA glycosylase